MYSYSKNTIISPATVFLDCQTMAEIWTADSSVYPGQITSGVFVVDIHLSAGELCTSHYRDFFSRNSKKQSIIDI